jgi:cytochrome P450
LGSAELRSTGESRKGAPRRRPFFWVPFSPPRPQLSIRRLASDPLGELDLLGSNGPLAVGFLGRQRLVYLSDPELVDEVCVGSDRLVGRARPVRRWWLIAPTSRRDGPELSTHDRAVYMQTRRRVMPFYGRDAARALLPVLVELAETLLSEAEGRELDLYPFLEELLVASAVCMLIGARAPADQLRGFTALYTDTQRMGATTFTSPLRTRLAAVRYRRRRMRALASRDEIGRRLVEFRRVGLARETTAAGLLERGEISVDMASGLIETVPDPTRTPLAFLVSALGRPELAARLAPEASAVLSGSDPDEAPAINAAVHEALRLGAPWRTNRVVLEPFTVAGFEAKQGDIFVTSPALLHRDQRFWTQPEAFRLDHWQEPRARPPRAFIPFGFASRSCAGKRMAIWHLAGLAALLARDWSVDCEDATALEWRAVPAGTLEPRHGLRCRFVRRSDGRKIR